MIQVQNPVYLNEARTKAVPDGHAEARFLLVGINGRVSDEEAKRYGITERGAPGQQETRREVPEGRRYMVNRFVPDGVNTAPDSLAANPEGEKIARSNAAAEVVAASEPVKPDPEPVKASAPSSPVAGKTTKAERKAAAKVAIAAREGGKGA